MYTRTYRQATGRRRPGRGIGAVAELVKHTEAGPSISPNASISQETQRVRHRRLPPELGWQGIGYSVLVFPSGRVYEGRGYRRSGAHTRGQNTRTLAACTPATATAPR